MNLSFVQIQHVSKVFNTPYGPVHALKDVSLGIRKGQLVAVTGKSGSGKSTFLNVLTGIDKPTRGSVNIDGLQVENMNEDRLAAWRGKNIGIVFQFFQLLPTLTIAENIMLPMDLCHTMKRADRRDRAMSLLGQVDILEQANKFPSMLSGGQQQRAAIARALANDPPVIVADEPTGNLDSHTAEAIFRLFEDVSSAGKTVVLVTHEKEFSSRFRGVVTFSDGELIDASGVEVAIDQRSEGGRT